MLDPATSAAQFENGKLQGRRSKDTLSTQFYACRLFRLGSPVLRLISASERRNVGSLPTFRHICLWVAILAKAARSLIHRKCLARDNRPSGKELL
jgi:hypothetical protein